MRSPTHAANAFARLTALFLAFLVPALAHAEGRIHVGAPVALGNGYARVVVAADTAGQPTSVSVLLDDSALEGLPDGNGSAHPVWEYVLPMPADAPATGYDHVGLDWNPAGHIPEGIYSLPHFDVHFYLVDQTARDRITFVGEAAASALQPPEPGLLPEGYVVAPGSEIARMGIHAVNTHSHEFHGRPFDHTFIYGYHEGRLVFVEPMVTVDHLRRRTDITMPIATPERYGVAGYYPTRYRIGFDAVNRRHHIALLGLRPEGF